jgi:glutamate---cysteine ligase / carboxylate-amine ligase
MLPSLFRERPARTICPKTNVTARPRLEKIRPFAAGGDRRRGEWLRTSTEAGDFTARGGEPKRNAVRQSLPGLV